MNTMFSVLMSVYNKENPEYFDLSLEHILVKQTLIPDEFILVCDGLLTDELDCVINKYQNQFKEIMKVFRLSSNVGLGRALNYGLEKCSYEIVARADSDDICREDRFEKQIRYLDANNQIAVVGSDIQEFDYDYKLPSAYKRMPSTNEDVLRMSKFRNPVNHMTAMFRKSAITDVGSYIHVQYVEDYYLWLRLLAKGYFIGNINEPLVFARVGNGMVARRSSKSYIASWRTVNRFMIENHMISKFDYLKNMFSVRVFVYLPSKFKKIVYSKVLRNNEQNKK